MLEVDRKKLDRYQFENNKKIYIYANVSKFNSYLFSLIFVKLTPISSRLNQDNKENHNLQQACVNRRWCFEQFST
jgi:hypothetical protein